MPELSPLPRPDWHRFIWNVGARIPRPVAEALARMVAPVVALCPPAPVRDWEETITRATGSRPTHGQRRRLLENWIRNNLWSLSLGRWSSEAVTRNITVEPGGLEKLRQSLAGPGLVLALPHSGSWDASGTWAAAHGIEVVSVAERLPAGLYERFRDARAAMGMRIYPLDHPGLMADLARDVRAGGMVCLLADRDLSSRGVRVPWPDGRGEVSVPAGPALLARRTGADLRVVTSHFDGPRLRIRVTDPITGDDVRATMQRVVAEFAAAVQAHPDNWLMLRRLFLDP